MLIIFVFFVCFSPILKFSWCLFSSNSSVFVVVFFHQYFLNEKGRREVIVHCLDGHLTFVSHIEYGIVHMWWGIFVFSISSPIFNSMNMNIIERKSERMKEQLAGQLCDAAIHMPLPMMMMICICYAAKSKYTCLYDYRPTSTLYRIQWTGIILINLINWTWRLPFLSNAFSSNS